MATSDDAWAFMTPWWDILRRHFLRMVYGVRNGHVYSEYTSLHLAVNLSGTFYDEPISQPQYQAMREAMELVSLLSVINRKEWVKGIFRHAHLEPRFSAERGSFTPPRFTLGLIAITDTAQQSLRIMQEMIAFMFAPLRLDARSIEYQETWRRLLASVPSSKIRKRCHNMRVAVVFDCSFQEHTMMKAFQRQLDIIYSRQQGESSLRVESEATCSLSLEGMGIDLEEPPDEARVAYRLGARLARRVVPLQSIGLGDLSSVGVRSIIRGALTRNSRDLELTTAGMFNQESDRVATFSMVAASSTLTSIKVCLSSDFDFEPQNPSSTRTRMLQWMVFAFFSRFSSTSLRKIDFTIFGVSPSDAAAAAAVLNARNPLEVLLNSSEPECQTSQLLEQLEIPDRRTGQVVVHSAGLEVWVVHNRPGSLAMDVLVPGHGVYAIERTKLSMPTQRSPSASGFQLVVIVITDTTGNQLYDHEGFLRFIDVIGSRATSLTIEGEEDTPFFSATSIPSIVRACPLLKYLELDGLTVDGIDSVVEAFEGDGCHIIGLGLNRIEIHSDVTSLDVLFAALKHPDTRIAQQLRELHIRTSKSSVWLARRLREVLNNNHVLHTVYVSAPPSKIKDTQRAIQDPTPTYVSIERKAFPLRSKLAFLSVINDTTSSVAPHVQNALGVLNRTMFQQIFKYAAPPLKRVAAAVKHP